MERDYQLIECLSKLGDDVMVGVQEVAALCDLAPITIQQRRTKGLPAPIPGPRRLRWRLGDIRTWIRGRAQQASAGRRKERA